MFENKTNSYYFNIIELQTKVKCIFVILIYYLLWIYVFNNYNKREINSVFF